MTSSRCFGVSLTISSISAQPQPEPLQWHSSSASGIPECRAIETVEGEDSGIEVEAIDVTEGGGRASGSPLLIEGTVSRGDGMRIVGGTRV